MRGLRFSLLVLALSFGMCSVARAQDEAIQITERDFAIATAEAHQHAITELRSEADNLRRSGNYAEAARTLNRVGRFQIRMFAWPGAVITFREALQLLEQGSDFKTRVDNLNGLASAYENDGKCTVAAPILEQAIILSRQEKYVPGEAEALWILSDCEDRVEHGKALTTVRQALELWRSIGHKRGMAQAYMTLGKFQMVQNDLAESEQSLKSAQALYRELNSDERQTVIHIYYGFIEYRKGAWQNALGFFAQAQSMVDERWPSEPFKRGQIATGIGEVFLASGLPNIALDKFREALDHYARAQSRGPQAETKWQIGRAQYFSAQYNEALETLLMAREEAREMTNVGLAARCDDYLGRTRNALNDPDGALGHFELALAGFKGRPREAARTRLLIGEINERRGKIDRARENYQSALESFRTLSDRVNESETLYALGGLELKQNNLDTAETYLKNSIDVTETIRRVSTSRDLTAAMSASTHDRYQRYVECLMRQHRAHPGKAFDVHAFETSELVRARSLAELLRATQTNLIPGVDSELAQRETSLRQSLWLKQDYRVTLLGTPYKNRDLDALDRELAQLEEQYKQTNDLIRARYPAYEQITAPGPLNLQRIQTEAIVDDQTLLLEYSLGPEKSYVWAVTRTGISSYELAGRKQIETEARRFYDLLSARQPKPGETSEQRELRIQQAETELPAAAAKLSTMLLAPLADQLGTKRLLIVADGALQYIPFQTLTLPVKTDPAHSSSTAVAEEQRPLVLDHEIINEPSASILALVLNDSANRTPVRGSVAVLADPVFEKDDPRITSAKTNAPSAAAVPQQEEIAKAFRDIGQPTAGRHIPRLPASRDEAQAIMDIVPWRTGFEALDFAANRATVVGSALTQYRIVHFATHAFLDDQHPESSGISLSLVDQRGLPQEGLLRMNDIYSLKLPVNLVVLSACNSGLGKDVKGEGLIGLTRGFMYAGAGGVAASLWKVDDEATAELMKHFYEGMFKRSLTPAAALREAQISMWQGKRYHSPYYWAAFVIQGQYDQNVSAGLTGTRNLYWIVAIGILGALTLIGFFLIRRRRKKIL